MNRTNARDLLDYCEVRLREVVKLYPESEKDVNPVRSTLIDLGNYFAHLELDIQNSRDHLTNALLRLNRDA